MRARLSPTFALSLLAGVSPALALAEQEVQFEYVAPPGCPSQADFLSRVRARVLGASPEKPPVERRGLVVRVNIDPRRGAAHVEFREPGAVPVVRQVQGDDCEELVSGVALITALAFGSRRSEAGRASSEEDAGETTAGGETPLGATPASASASASESAVPAEPQTPQTPQTPERPAPMAGPKTTRTVARGARARSPRRVKGAAPSRTKPAKTAAGAEALGESALFDERPAPRRVGFDAGTGAWVTSWLSPGRTLGADAFARVGNADSGWAARLSVGYGAGATARVDEREADFSFIGGRLEGCPLGFVFAPAARLEPCLAVELGRLRGAGREDSALRLGADESVFWAAGVVVGRLRTLIARSVVVEVQAELGIPITSHDFVFEDPETEVFSAPSFGGGGRIGVGVPFL